MNNETTQINTVYFESIDSSSAAIYKITCKMSEIALIFNCVKSHYAHFVRNILILHMLKLSSGKGS